MNKVFTNFGIKSDDNRKDELIRIITHSTEQLTLPELEALYYDIFTKGYIKCSLRSYSLGVVMGSYDEELFLGSYNREL